jgi:tetratricopeptide (TPR) repeat protein
MIRQFLFLFFTLTCFLKLDAQNYERIDSLKSAIQAAKKLDTTVVSNYQRLSFQYTFYRPDSALFYNAIAGRLADSLKFERGIFLSLLSKSLNHSYLRNDSIALKTAFLALKFAEEKKILDYLRSALRYLGLVYYNIRQFDNAIIYAKKAFQMTAPNDSSRMSNQCQNIAEIYDDMGLVDSSARYVNMALEFGKGSKRLSTFSYYLMGNVYLKRGQYDLALSFYKESYFLEINFSKNAKDIMDIEIGMTKLFQKKGDIDSAIHYARLAYIRSKKVMLPREKLESLSLLTSLYKQKGNIDSAFFYISLTSELKDSLINAEKFRTIGLMTYNEESRQEKLAEEKLIESKERNHNIQLAITAIGILTAVILFLLLSRSIIVSHKLIEILGVIVLLVVFEFINLLIHPWLEKITHHSPILMLLALVAIAALIVPLHHKLEHWTTQKLVEKNKTIRLANAKKTIEELEVPNNL